MSIKLADTLAPMADFPVAMAEHIEFSDGENLQKKLDDGSLGGSGGATYTELSQEEYDTLSDEERLNGSEYRTYDTGRIYKLGVLYGKCFDDAAISTDSTWSSSKTSAEFDKKQDDIRAKRIFYQRNGSANPQYALIATIENVSAQTSFVNPLQIQGTYGTLSGTASNFDIMINARNGLNTNMIKGYQWFGVKTHADIVVTKSDDGNTGYIYADFPNAYGYITANVIKSQNDKYVVADAFKRVSSMEGTEVARLSTSSGVVALSALNDTVSNKLTANNNVSMVGLGFTNGEEVNVTNFLGALVAKFGNNGYCDILYANANSAKVVNATGTQSVLINGGILYFSATNDKFPNTTWAYAEAIYYPIEGIQGKMYKFFAKTGGTSGTVVSSGVYQYSSDTELIADSTASTASTWSSSKIASEISNKFLVGTEPPTTDTCPVGCFYGVYE